MSRTGGGASWRVRGTAGALVLALAASLAGCDGDGAGRGARDEGRTAGAAAADAGDEVPRSPSEELGLDEGWGPDRAELDRAAEQVGRLRLPELAGQLIVASWSGTRAPVRMVHDLHLGGVIAFDANVASADQVRAVNRALARSERKRGWPLFIGVDQEGGVVERLRGVATRFPSFMSAGAADDTDLTRRVYAASGAELRGLGFTVDFAPDADVTSGPGDPTIGSRAASSDPSRVAEHVVAAAGGFSAAGVLPVVKHFPGHGSVPADSHVTLPVQTKTREELERTDLVPFREAVSAGLPAVMVGHLDVRAIDRGVPSSLSRPVVTGLLRDDLDFGGLVVSDALDMAGVTRGRDAGRVAVQAVRAGVDVLLMPPSPAAARTALVRAVRTGALPRRRLEQAAARQVALLTHLRTATGEATGQATGKAAGQATAEAQAASRALSAAAVTVTDGPCSGPLVGASVHAHGDPGAVAAFAAAAGRAGLEVLLRRSPPTGLTRVRPRPERRRHEGRRHYRERRREWARAEARRERRLARWTAREDARLATGTSVGFTGYHDAPVDGEVAVATDSPWVLGRVSAPTRIATYGDTPAAMEVLVEVLRGQAAAPGRLPVTVAGVSRRGC